MKPNILYILLLSSSCCLLILSSCGSHPKPSSGPAQKPGPATKDTIVIRDSLVARDSVRAPYKDTIPYNDTTGIVQQISPADLVNSRIVPDTVISYEIDGESISLEGNEASVHYINNIWKEADWSIFGETGKNIIHYQPVGDSLVKVEEKLYRYRNMQFPKSNSDIRLDQHFIYMIDTNGKIVSVSKGKKEDINDVFNLFKKYIPLIIRLQ